MRRRKINDDRLIELLNQGKLQKEAARELGVSEAAITKRLKKLHPERYQVPESFSRLSDKEKEFVVLKSEGKSNTEAALTAFDCSSRESAKALGFQLMQKPDVRMSVDEALNTVGLNRLYRMSKLKKHVDSPDPVVGLKALDMSMKAGGDYGDGESREKKDASKARAEAAIASMDDKAWIDCMSMFASIGSLKGLRLAYANYYLSLQGGWIHPNAINARDEIEAKIEGWVKEAEKNYENYCARHPDKDSLQQESGFDWVRCPLPEFKRSIVEALQKKFAEEGLPILAQPNLEDDTHREEVKTDTVGN